MTLELTARELAAVVDAVGDRLAGEWDETFKGENECLERAAKKLRAALKGVAK